MNLHFRMWSFYYSPGQAWDAMYEDCSQAKYSIEMEQYIFHNDEVGQAFMQLFIEKAKQGIAIRLLCDEVGSASFRHSLLVEEFRRNGGVFHFFNSFKWIDFLKPRRIFPRTHMKALVIDGEIAYMGGVCIALRMKKWRDTHIRVMGPVVSQVKKALNRNSHEVLGKKHKEIGPIAKKEQSSDGDFTYIQNDPAFFRHPIYQAMLASIHHAREYIYISAAFFVPTLRLRRSLRQAAARGVQVIILVPNHSESTMADWACLSYVLRLVKGNVHIFRYQPTILHTKTIVVDGKWGMVGSCNMDPLSFFHNREANLIVKSKDALATMRIDFLKDLESSIELTLEIYKNIPLWKRLAAHLARVLRPIL